MLVQDFFNQWNGKGIDFDHYYGYQCMDLFEQYNHDVVGCPVIPGNAIDVPNTFNHDFYDWIPNTPEGVPALGDVICWNSGVGVNGHIAVFKDGDQNTFTSFDQNWPLNSLCHFQTHNYTNVAGWLHPKTATKSAVAVLADVYTMLVTKATKWDGITALGYQSPDDVKSKVDTLQNQLDHCNNDLKTCQTNIVNPPVATPVTITIPVLAGTPPTQVIPDTVDTKVASTPPILAHDTPNSSHGTPAGANPIIVFLHRFFNTK